MNKLNHRLYFRESKLSSYYELFHKFAENFIFFRWMYFKNRPRTTFLMMRSVLVNSLAFSAYYYLFSHFDFLIMGIEVDPVLLYFGACTVGYWNMSWNFFQKCNYLSSMYNDIIKLCSKTQGLEAQMLRINFSMQLLTMDLWGHRLYSWILNETLEETFEWAIQNKTVSFKNMNEFYEVANNKKLEISVARSALLDYLQHLSHMATKTHLSKVA